MAFARILPVSLPTLITIGTASAWETLPRGEGANLTIARWTSCGDTRVIADGDNATNKDIKGWFEHSTAAVTLVSAAPCRVESKFDYRRNPILKGQDAGCFHICSITLPNLEQWHGRCADRGGEVFWCLAKRS
jgi:hypothetical protein